MFSFFQRPSKTISKSEYIEEAKKIGERAKALAAAAAELKKTQESSGRNRKVKQQAKALGKELSVLEEDEKTLESLYPQVCYVAHHGYACIDSTEFAPPQFRCCCWSM